MHIHAVTSVQGRGNPDVQALSARPVPRRASSPPLLQSASSPDTALLELSSQNPVQHRVASRPRWQQSFGPSAMARHQLGLAITEDNWQGVKLTQTQHPQFSFCNDALLKLAAQTGAIGVASWLQCQGADPFGPDAADSAFYAALRSGNGGLASQMLAFRQLMDPASFPDLKPYLAAALDDRDSAAISLLLQFSVQLKSLMPFDLLARDIAADNVRRIALLITQRSMSLALQSHTAERMLVHFAIGHGSAATLGLLLNRAPGLERATRLCERNDSTGNTALHRAVASGDLEKLRLILDFDPGVRTATGSIRAENSDGKTASALALQAGRTDMVDLLGSRGALAQPSEAADQAK